MLKKLKKILCPAFVFTAFSAVNVFAEGETKQVNPLAMVMQFVPLVLIFVVFYFLLIRPQKKKEKALKDMISSLKVGDTVAAEQSLITVEGDKASMEVPAPFAGTVKEIKISTGDKVKTGSLIMVFEVEGAAPAAAPAQAAAPAPAAAASPRICR